MTIPNFAMVPMDFIGSKGNSSTNKIDSKMIQYIAMEIPIYPDPVYRPPPKPEKLATPKIPRKLRDINQDPITDIEDNSSFQEGIISEMYQRWDKSYFEESEELDSLINTWRLVLYNIL